MNEIKVGLIGLGLIGGSIARGLQKGPDGERISIIAYNRSKESLYAAKDSGIAEEIYEELNEDALRVFGSLDYIFLCAPVKTNNDYMEKLVPYLSERAVLTDVGSVKGPFHKKAEELGIENKVIGGHPMAGSEKTGFLNSKESLLENAYYIITPGRGVDEKRVDEFKSLVEGIKAIPIIIPPEKHDYITAAISHLPHVVSASLVNLVHDEDTDGMMKRIAAGGFKDITRISSSSPEMWENICLLNRDNILKLIDDYDEVLMRARAFISDSDEDDIFGFFDDAKNFRDSFAEVISGPIKRSFVLSIDVKDESGAIAKTASLLANENISIKNIGIVHNRESGEGALKIAFYDAIPMAAAREILLTNGYKVF